MYRYINIYIYIYTGLGLVCCGWIYECYAPGRPVSWSAPGRGP